MKVFLATLAVAGLALSSGAAIAQDSAAAPLDNGFLGVDTDTNGAVSWAEFNLLFPEITEEQFNTADADGTGDLSQAEFDTLAISTGSVQSDAPPAEPNAVTNSLTTPAS